MIEARPIATALGIMGLVMVGAVVLGLLGLIALLIGCDRAAECERLEQKKLREQQYH